MSFPRYPKYKESGVEWLGEVPEHWKHLPVWLLFEIGRGRVISNEEILDNIGDFPVYSSQTEANGVMGYINTYDFDGDYLTWTTDGANAGTVFRRTGKFNCTNVCGTLKPKTADVSLDYCCHALAISTRPFVRLDINPKLMNNVMAKIRIPVPTLAEQTAIADFLAHETAKIDALVQEQERLIELLKEKRQAVISHAVTKGLNPKAPMKDSGIEWLGQVPAHWEIKPLRRFSCFVQSGPFGSQLHADEYVSGQVPVVNPVNLVNGQIIPSEDVTVTSDVVERLAHQKLHAGDVVFSRRGELGRCALVSEREAGWLCGTGSMILRLHKSEYNAGYLSAYLSLELLRQYFVSFSVGAIMDSLSSATLLAMPMIVPPMSEQASIVCFVNEQEDSLNQLISTAQRAIDLFQERRTALISAAVTGKIDVRKVAAPSAQEVA